MSTNLKPLGARVLLEKSKRDNMTAGGIALPDSVIHAETRYKVVKVGAGCESGVTEGAFVVIPQFSGTIIGEYTVLEENLIIAEYEQE